MKPCPFSSEHFKRLPFIWYSALLLMKPGFSSDDFSRFAVEDCLCLNLSNQLVQLTKGISGTVLERFNSYLKDRTFCVGISRSSTSRLHCGWGLRSWLDYVSPFTLFAFRTSHKITPHQFPFTHR